MSGHTVWVTAIATTESPAVQRPPLFGPAICGPAYNPAILVGVTKPQVGSWVRRKLDAKKISVKLAADRSGLSRQTWYDLMANRYPPSVDTQRGVAEGLRVALSWYDDLSAGREPQDIDPADQPDELTQLRADVAELEATVRELAALVRERLRATVDDGRSTPGVDGASGLEPPAGEAGPQAT